MTRSLLAAALPIGPKDKIIAMRYGHCSCLNSIGDGALTFNQTGTR
jgi:hypothetical protein